MNKEDIKALIREVLAEGTDEVKGAISVSEVEPWDAGVIETECGLEVADKDYYEVLKDGTKKTHFTWDEAMEIELKTGGKWRLPTAMQWMKLVCEFCDTGEGKPDPNELVEQLGLGLHGWQDLDRDKTGTGAYGCYWSSTAGTASSAYNLDFSSSNVNPQYGNDRGFGLSVRLIKAERGDE